MQVRMLPKRICKTLIGKSRVAIFFVVTIALITVFLVLSFLVLPKYFPTVYIFEKKSSLDVTDNFLINNQKGLCTESFLISLSVYAILYLFYNMKVHFLVFLII
jgi:hypothetical protein